jgi:type VI secretion system protein ImpA
VVSVASLVIETYLEPVQLDAPCGPDLEATEGNALSVLAAEPQDSGIKGIDTVDTRNWRDIRARAERLLSQTKNLRVAIILVRTLLHTEGVTAFCQGISLLRRLMEQYWTGLHPTGGGDFEVRLFALADLWSDDLLNALRATPVLKVSGLGEFSVRDVLVAKGLEKPRAGVTPPNAQVMLRALEAAPETAALVAALRLALDELVALRSFALAQVPDGFLDPSRLEQLLGSLRDALPHTNGQAATPAQPASSQPVVTEASMSIGNGSPVVQYRERELESREDVVELLDRICVYYERHEPSSPIPLLLQRARRLVTMNFMELIRELADKGVPQIEAITGKEPKS